jgi:hypothetical protein
MRVSTPPVNRMTQSATMPTNCACPMLLNCIPRPSQPKSIPARRNSNNVGIPKRPPAFVISILQKINIEPTRIIFPEVKKAILFYKIIFAKKILTRSVAPG